MQALLHHIIKENQGTESQLLYWTQSSTESLYLIKINQKVFKFHSKWTVSTQIKKELDISITRLTSKNKNYMKKVKCWRTWRTETNWAELKFTIVHPGSMNSREALGSMNSGGPRVNVHGVNSPATQVGDFPARNVSNSLWGKWVEIKKAKAWSFRERLRVNGVKGDVFCLLAHILLLNTESFPDTQNKG